LTKEEIYQIKSSLKANKKLKHKTLYMISHKDSMHILIADDDEDDRTFLVRQ
jgi:hypothetical protein